MKKVNITTIILFIYLAVMAVIGWKNIKPEDGYTGYFGVLIASIVVILLLRFVQIKRFKNREELKNQRDKDKGL